MASIIIRGLDDETKEQLTKRAASHHRSMEAEVRSILTETVRAQNTGIGLAIMQAVQAVGGIEDLPAPARHDPARVPDLE